VRTTSSIPSATVSRWLSGMAKASSSSLLFWESGLRSGGIQSSEATPEADPSKCIFLGLGHSPRLQHHPTVNNPATEARRFGCSQPSRSAPVRPQSIGRDLCRRVIGDLEERLDGVCPGLARGPAPRTRGIKSSGSIVRFCFGAPQCPQSSVEDRQGVRPTSDALFGAANRERPPNARPGGRFRSSLRSVAAVCATADNRPITVVTWAVAIAGSVITTIVPAIVSADESARGQAAKDRGRSPAPTAAAPGTIPTTAAPAASAPTASAAPTTAATPEDVFGLGGRRTINGRTRKRKSRRRAQ
jgi:hypothetical protein